MLNMTNILACSKLKPFGSASLDPFVFVKVELNSTPCPRLQVSSDNSVKESQVQFMGLCGAFLRLPQRIIKSFIVFPFAYKRFDEDLLVYYSPCLPYTLFTVN